MNKTGKHRRSDAGDVDVVGKLISSTGGRTAVGPERYERVHDRVLAHWEQVVAERESERRPRRIGLFAAAAGIVMALGVATIVMNMGAPGSAATVASVERLIGQAESGGRALNGDSKIRAGERIVTGADGMVALRLSAGQSLRLDSSSRVVVQANDRLSLETGALYIDSDFADANAAVRVNTPLGSAQDVGTRFQVRLKDRALVVGVRDGLVEVAREDGPPLSVNSGQYVALGENGDTVTRELVRDDPDWHWVDEVVPEYEIQGATLAQYLAWYAHERDIELVWASAASKANAQSIILSGSIAGTGLDEGLELVKRIAPFRHEIMEDGFRVTVD